MWRFDRILLFVVVSTAAVLAATVFDVDINIAKAVVVVNGFVPHHYHHHHRDRHDDGFSTQTRKLNDDNNIAGQSRPIRTKTTTDTYFTSSRVCLRSSRNDDNVGRRRSRGSASGNGGGGSSSLGGGDGSYESLLPETSFSNADSVPEGQRPINEYLNMLRQPLYGWATEENGTIGLVIRLFLVYLLVFGVVCYPISGATYTEDGYLIQKLAASNVGAILIIFILLVRLYSGWGYVGSRLTSKSIEFEETGWYDGDIEMKDDKEYKRDKFLYQSKVLPTINRLKSITSFVGVLWLISIVGYNVANSNKPIFDEYDPSVLERLSYDEKLAERAAAASPNGKPTYCDNRYYRAVANGGQGCK